MRGKDILVLRSAQKYKNKRRKTRERERRKERIYTPTSSRRYLQCLRDRLRALVNGTRRRETSSHGELQQLFFSRYSLTGYSQIVIVITQRTWLALGTIIFFFFFSSPRQTSFFIPLLFSSLYRPLPVALVSFFGLKKYIFQLSPRDPHAIEGTSCQPAFITSNIHVCAYYTLCIPIERVRCKYESVIKIDDRQNSKLIIFKRICTFIFNNLFEMIDLYHSILF